MANKSDIMRRLQLKKDLDAYKRVFQLQCASKGLKITAATMSNINQTNYAELQEMYAKIQEMEQDLNDPIIEAREDLDKEIDEIHEKLKEKLDVLEAQNDKISQNIEEKNNELLRIEEELRSLEQERELDFGNNEAIINAKIDRANERRQQLTYDVYSLNSKKAMKEMRISEALATATRRKVMAMGKYNVKVVALGGKGIELKDDELLQEFNSKAKKAVSKSKGKTTKSEEEIQEDNTETREELLKQDIKRARESKKAIEQRLNSLSNMEIEAISDKRRRLEMAQAIATERIRLEMQKESKEEQIQKLLDDLLNKSYAKIEEPETPKKAKDEKETKAREKKETKSEDKDETIVEEDKEVQTYETPETLAQAAYVEAQKKYNLVLVKNAPEKIIKAVQEELEAASKLVIAESRSLAVINEKPNWFRRLINWGKEKLFGKKIEEKGIYIDLNEEGDQAKAFRENMAKTVAAREQNNNQEQGTEQSKKEKGQKSTRDIDISL